MYGSFDLLEIMWFGVPILAIVFFIISLCLYLTAKGKNRRVPGSVNEGELKTKKVLLIVSACIAGVIVLAYVSLILMLMMSIAHM